MHVASNVSISRSTLLFDNAEQETGFALTQKIQLATDASRLVLLVFFPFLVVSMLLVLTEYPDQDSLHSALAERLPCIAALGLVLLLFGVLLQCGGLVSRMCPSTLEVALISVFVYTMCNGVLSNPYYAGWVWERGSKVHWGHKAAHTDSGTLLIINGIVTASHVGMPVRWCFLLPLELFSIALYAVLVFVVGSCEGWQGGVHNLLLLSATVFVLATGKRSSEMKQRRAFLDSVTAGTCWHRLSGDTLQEQRSSNLPALPARSDQVFGALFKEGADMKRELANIEQVAWNEHWCLNQEELRLLPKQVLGRGGFGVVVKGIYCNTIVAVKLPQTKITSKTLGLPELCNELRVLKRLRHPNIVLTHGAIIDAAEQRMGLVLEYIDGQRLDVFMTESPSMLNRHEITLGTCSALDYMHSRRPSVVHGDLKSDNIIVKLSGQHAHPKLVDFGLSQVLTQPQRALGGSLVWMAPEVFNGRAVRCGSDMYSLGRLIAFVHTGKVPTLGVSSDTWRHLLKSGRSPLPQWPPNNPFVARSKPLVEACLQGERSRRPSAEKAYLILLAQAEELGLPVPSTAGDQALPWGPRAVEACLPPTQ